MGSSAKKTEAVLIAAGALPPSIRWVQAGLNQVLGLRLSVDGFLGPQTRSAIRGFQKKQGLTVTGSPFDPTFARNLLCMLASMDCVGSIPLPPPGDEAFRCSLCITCGVIPHSEQ